MPPRHMSQATALITVEKGESARYAQTIITTVEREIEKNPALNGCCRVTTQQLRTDSGMSACFSPMPPNCIAVDVIKTDAQGGKATIVSVSCMHDNRFTITTHFANDGGGWERFWSGELPFVLKRMREILSAYPDKTKLTEGTGTTSPFYEARFRRIRERAKRLPEPLLALKCRLQWANYARQAAMAKLTAGAARKTELQSKIVSAFQADRLIAIDWRAADEHNGCKWIFHFRGQPHPRFGMRHVTEVRNICENTAETFKARQWWPYIFTLLKGYSYWEVYNAAVALCSDPRFAKEHVSYDLGGWQLTLKAHEQKATA